MNGLPKCLLHSRPFALASAVLAWLVLVTVSSPAFASGSFKLRSTTVEEVSGGWHIYCDVALAKPPLTPHETLKFLFTRTAVYERDLVDNNPNPVVNRQVLVNQNPSVESLEVDFSDASGKIYKITHFDFSLTRVRGYEAGEYKLQVKTSDGVEVGAPAMITLNGKNDVVDRRAMSFEAKGIKKVAAATSAAPAKTDDPVAAAPANGDVAPAGSAPPFLSADAFKTQPEEIADHPKGCGCSVPGLDPSGAPGGTQALAAACLGLGLSIVAWRKRRIRSGDV